VARSRPDAASRIRSRRGASVRTTAADAAADDITVSSASKSAALSS
jgi:hypothetical protein